MCSHRRVETLTQVDTMNMLTWRHPHTEVRGSVGRCHVFDHQTSDSKLTPVPQQRKSRSWDVCRMERVARHAFVCNVGHVLGSTMHRRVRSGSGALPASRVARGRRLVHQAGVRAVVLCLIVLSCPVFLVAELCGQTCTHSLKLGRTACFPSSGPLFQRPSASRGSRCCCDGGAPPWRHSSSVDK